jgi:hypothetical protein
VRGGPDNITAIVVEVLSPDICSAKSNGGQPASPKRELPPKPFSIALAIVMAVCWLAAAGLLLADQVRLSVVTAVLGVIAMLTGLAQRLTSSSAESLDGSRYGSGPHRQFKAQATYALFEQLAGTMKPLREAAEERNWKIHWTELDRAFTKACGLADGKNYAEAIRIQAKVLIDLMNQIRRQRGLSNSDSAIDL